MPTPTITPTTFIVTARTDFDTTSIVTVVQPLAYTPDRYWTLVATADGVEYVVTPEGKHVNATGFGYGVAGDPAVQRFLDWFSEYGI